MEKTRRLLFVSTTRARDLLYLTGVYCAYGSEKDGYTYNQFIHELYKIKGMPYDPVDHVKEAAALKRTNNRKGKFSDSVSGQISFS